MMGLVLEITVTNGHGRKGMYSVDDPRGELFKKLDSQLRGFYVHPTPETAVFTLPGGLNIAIAHIVSYNGHNPLEDLGRRISASF